ncbi:MAG: OmpH family outer membrane protein [Bacteroidales bacterium]|nr:OmpH family outer membrane protein [Bacteroidales bacterium]
MKKKAFICLLATLALALGATAQKYACVNTQYILTNMPDYTLAQQRLDKYAADWQTELETKFQEIDRMYKTYQQEAYLLPDNLKRKREDEIIAKEKEAKDLQKKRFGSGGDLDKKREELVKPIQDKVYNAIERIAREKNYAFILDKAGSATLLFVNAKYDISDEILEQLGYTPNATTQDNAAANAGSDKPTERKGNPEMKRDKK